MTIEYYDGTNGDGLFNILGKAGHALNTLNTSRLTTVPAEVLDAVNQYKKKTNADLQMDRALEGLAGAVSSWQRSGTVLANQLQRYSENLLTEIVRADSVIARPSLTESLEYLIDEMAGDGYYVDPNVVGSSVVADGGNSSTTMKIAVAHVNGDFEDQQNMLAETLTITAQGSTGSISLQILGETLVSDLLSEEWPGGSGANENLPQLTTSDSIATNPGFETWENGAPEGWLITQLGAGPTTYRQTVLTQQTVIISGTPTSGHYSLLFTDPITSNVYATSNLPYNATASQIQTALRLLPGLGSVTVTSTGTTPNFTHTVVFSGVAAAVAILSSNEFFDTGSIAHAITVTGDAGASSGLGLVVEGGGDGVLLASPIQPTARQLYVWSMKFRTLVSGDYSVTASLKKGIGGSDVEAQNGDAMDEVFTFAATPGTANLTAVGFFAIAADTPLPIYMHVSVTSDEDMVIDDVIVTPVNVLYPGGPTVVAIPGRIPPIAGDKWTVPTTNNGAGALQTLCHRLFDMAGKRLLIPSAGSTNIPDSVIG